MKIKTKAKQNKWYDAKEIVPESDVPTEAGMSISVLCIDEESQFIHQAYYDYTMCK